MERNDFPNEPRGASVGDAMGERGGGVVDRARDLAGSARDRIADAGSSAREQAGHLRESLADALSSSADKLRQRAGAQLAAPGAEGTIAVEADGRMAGAATKVASGIDATADWLRRTDLDHLRADIEHQVKEHPGRTLLIAVGVGYLLGKALRR